MEAWEQQIAEHGHLFPMDKKVFQPEEIALAYHIFNLKNGTMKRDTGCGACRRDVIIGVKKLVERFAK